MAEQTNLPMGPGTANDKCRRCDVGFTKANPPFWCWGQGPYHEGCTPMSENLRKLTGTLDAMIEVMREIAVALHSNRG